MLVDLSDHELELIREGLRARATYLRAIAAESLESVSPRIRKLWRDEARRYGLLAARIELARTSPGGHAAAE